MGAPLAIRTDIGALALRRMARRERDGRVAARLIALANVLDGMSLALQLRSSFDVSLLRGSLMSSSPE